MVASYKMYINGSSVPAYTRESYPVINPGNEQIIARVPQGGTQDARSAIDAARRAFDFGVWSAKLPAERATILWKLADLVEAHTPRLARLESMNQGKTIKWAQFSDFPFIIDNLRFFAGMARTLEGTASAEYSGMGTSIIRREPIGVVAAIVPWNYPLYIAVWKMAPALAAGNTVVIKPASLTPLTLLEFAKLAQIAGVPKGVLNVVTGPGDVVGSELVNNNKVDMIAMTGDTETGKKIMQKAASSVKRVHLELGGKAPLIVLPDADIEMASQGAVIGGFWNTGQDCTAVTRVIAHRSVYKKMVAALVARARKIRVGNQLLPTTDMGPLVSARQRERVAGYVESGIQQGAKVALGGTARKGKGFFFSPTILTNTTQDMKVCREEIFGPVICMYEYETEQDAIEHANDVPYGLAASVYGKNVSSCMRVAGQLDFGTVWINEHGVLVSEMPHGGFKQSGFGKDLSKYAFDDYTRIKHVYIDTTGEVRRSWHWTVVGKKK